MVMFELERRAKFEQRVSIDAAKFVALIHKLQSADPNLDIKLFSEIEVIAMEAADSIDIL